MKRRRRRAVWGVWGGLGWFWLGGGFWGWWGWVWLGGCCGVVWLCVLGCGGRWCGVCGCGCGCWGGFCCGVVFFRFSC
ncbi:hypothetical protein [Pseudomonas syringae group genomosp. 7]|uniref:hypothetical protein n=1 Tax=Pseudomonas syringae group genomosp. 7 TaxID=251699 RepID=UPI003770422B